MKKQIYVCVGDKCHARGSRSILDFLLGKNESGEIDCDVTPCRCLGNCERGVNVAIGENQVIHEVTEENVLAKLEDESGYEPLRHDSANVDVDSLFDEL